MFRTLVRAAKFTPALAVLLPLAAQAADRAFCAGYTDAAMEQVHRAIVHPTCVGGARGARWARDRRVHFEWCLGANPAAAAGERRARADFLRGCGG
jgi:hypothetical protein